MSLLLDWWVPSLVLVSLFVGVFIGRMMGLAELSSRVRAAETAKADEDKRRIAIGVVDSIAHAIGACALRGWPIEKALEMVVGVRHDLERGGDL